MNKPDNKKNLDKALNNYEQGEKPIDNQSLEQTKFGKFIPIYKGRSSKAIVALEEKMQIFLNHCCPFPNFRMRDGRDVPVEVTWESISNGYRYLDGVLMQETDLVKDTNYSIRSKGLDGTSRDIQSAFGESFFITIDKVSYMLRHYELKQ